MKLSTILYAIFGFIIVGSGAIGIVATSKFGVSRKDIATFSFVSFDIAIYGIMLVAWLPLPEFKGRSGLDRLATMLRGYWTIVAGTTYWFDAPLLLVPGWQWVIEHQSEPAAFAWAIYADGGDTRFLNPDAWMYYMETLTFINAVLTTYFMIRWVMDGKPSIAGVHMLMLGSVSHFVLTGSYYYCEWAQNWIHTDGSIGNFWGKMIISNSPWLLCPPLIIYWGLKTLPGLYAEAAKRVAKKAN